MFCTNCGKPLADDANFCPDCGTARPAEAAAAEAPVVTAEPAAAEEQTHDEPLAQPELQEGEQIYAEYTPQPAAKKKGGKTALLMIAGIAAAVILALALLFGGSPAQPNGDSEGIYAIVDELDLLLADSFEQYSIEYSAEDDCIAIATWSDGIAEATQYVNSNSSLQASWQTLRNNMCDMSLVAKQYVDESGYEATSVIVSLLNDQNRENVLLLCIDGSVYYDCTAQ